MDESSFVLFAYDFDGKGGGKNLIGSEIQKKLKAKQLAWVHLDGVHQYTSSWISKSCDYLDPLIIDALLENETRPRVTFFKQGAMIILRGMNLNKKANPEDMISLRLWIDDSRIISVQLRPLKAIEDVKASFGKKKAPKDAGEFLGKLCQSIFERMQPVLFELSDYIDEVEESIIDEKSSSIRHEINDIRKKTLIFKRYLNPQKDVMLALRNADITWIKPNHIRQFQENQDRLTRYLEDLDTIRERAQIVKDEYVAMQSDKMNKNTYILSVIAGVFLPLGFLTGLMGINVGGMPLVENNEGFWIITVLCTISAIGILGFFRWLKWL